MGITLAFLSAIFNSITAILGKKGMRDINTGAGTIIRSTIIFLCTVVIVLYFGSFHIYSALSFDNYFYLTLSGIVGAVAWGLYFHAVKIGTVSNVLPLNKSSLLFTIFFSIFFLGEVMTFKLGVVIALIFISLIFLMAKDKDEEVRISRQWIFFALVAACFSGLIPVLYKMGLENVETRAALAYRALIFMIIAWIYGIFRGSVKELTKVNPRTWILLTLSAIATGIGWFCYFEALSMENVTTVSVIDRSSVVFTLLLSFVFLREKISLRVILGTLVITSALVLMIFF